MREDRKNLSQLILKDLKDEDSDDGLDDIPDLINEPLMRVRKNENKLYQYHLPMQDGVYEGTVGSKITREGLGSFNVNNGEELYAGEWRSDKPNGPGYMVKNYGALVYYGQFQDGKLEQGYGRRMLDNGYVYEGKFKGEKFNGLGELSIDVKGISSSKDSTLKVIAEWKNGRVGRMYLNEIEEKYSSQYAAFEKWLKAIVFNQNLEERKVHLGVFFALLDQKYYGTNLLNEIAKIDELPANLKSAASFLAKIDDAYQSLNSYYSVSKKSYTDCVRSSCNDGLSDFASMLEWSCKRSLTSNELVRPRDVFGSSLADLIRKNASKPVTILYIDPNVIELIRRLVEILNDQLPQTASAFHALIILSESKRLKALWDDYLTVFSHSQSLHNKTGQNLFKAAYASLLKHTNWAALNIEAESPSETNPITTQEQSPQAAIKAEVQGAMVKTFEFVLQELKPWRQISMKHVNTYLSGSFDSLSWKRLGDKLLMKLMKDSFAIINKHISSNSSELRDLSNDLEGFVISYESYLSNLDDVNYELRMKEIDQIVNYFVSCLIKDASMDDIIESQLKNINYFLESGESIAKIVEVYIDFNSELARLIGVYNKLFDDSTGPFNVKQSEIVDKCKQIFRRIFECRDEEETIAQLTFMRQDSKKNSDAILTALNTLSNLLTNLTALDYKWYVERANLGESPYWNGFNDNLVEVNEIAEAQKSINQPHYVLDTVYELVTLIETEQLLTSADRMQNLNARNEVMAAISKSFKFFADQTKYASLESFKNDCVEPFNEFVVNNKSERFEELKEKLSKVELYFLYSRKLKEITVDQALQMFLLKNASIDEDGYMKIKSAHEEYEREFNDYFSRLMNYELSVPDLVKKAKDLASEEWKEKTIQNCGLELREKTIPKMIAILSLVLSLNASGFIENDASKNFSLKKASEFNQKYFLKPHAIQILGLLKILSLDNTNDSIENHLGEILTGQGKSWLLTLLAGFFDLIGYNVMIACYSDYLSSRDSSDFSKFMKPFQFSRVKYNTFTSICNGKISGLRDRVRSIIDGTELKRQVVSDRQDNSVMLVDEVDVFFSSCFGKFYHPSTCINNKHLADVQKFIWERIVQNTTADEIKSQALARLSAPDTMIANLVEAGVFEKYITKMINDALDLFSNEEKYKHKFKLINGRVFSKDDERYVESTYFGYRNAFFYLKTMYEKSKSFQNVELNENQFGYLTLTLGNVSYSEIPREFKGLFGVSGSLVTLSDAEKSLLSYYNIDLVSYYPSFFGRQKVIFDETKDFRLEKTPKDWIDCIIRSCRDKLKKNRAVLVFFSDEKTLFNFLTFKGDLGTEPLYITLNETFDGSSAQKYSDADVSRLIKMEFAGHHDRVTLLTREFGRGVDFEAEAKVVEKGGVHVIQTFLSVDIKEEIQIRGRTARKDDPGSYELIVCLEHIQEIDKSFKKFKVDDNSASSAYSTLNEMRNELLDKECSAKKSQIDSNRERHDKTMKLYRDALESANSANRIDFIKQIDFFN